MAQKQLGGKTVSHILASKVGTPIHVTKEATESNSYHELTTLNPTNLQRKCNTHQFSTSKFCQIRRILVNFGHKHSV